ncbi:Cysteine synthase (CysK) (PDB:1FCJ) [Commensalibacter communis]|uniref:Cysteine synthase (CysK) n=1 Tax=Commensalibacter communis TaxID=2972786 RepID=A0A9W4TRI2_9PROT|nr:Cysteine synthase (CysK) (PDB:1FCJ) [Commensalibacter communis]CAI3955577.1 Cysteine synthase (CysK) (PDB:1FCJ) [Commensalibacter communis]CAI3957522.1 Cysteine synthase (CysK) (PDB:1FCJ) [Commensalibacter communis]CAI3958310.1 Cysteine synthase (CysK) (PDB:1FCJ) [Commensalibacter communis]CAI3959496.1 Cysteine synthase (CysK) (PDB:1FCJ) [Commensalibacter communis]
MECPDYFNSDIYTKISKLFDGTMQLKLERFDLMGSIKMKTVLHIIFYLEQKGLIGPDAVLIQSSSDNLVITLSAE